MDKGIRPACNAKFLELLPTRANTTAGNTAFRKAVMFFVMEEYGATLASAATHYNHAFKKARENPMLAVMLAGLGRPEDKKGGRKAKVKPEALPATEGTPAALLLLTNNPTVETAATQEGTAPEGAAQEESGVDEQAAPPAEQTVFTVKRKKDDEVVAENLSFEEATALVQKAADAKKAKLYWI